MSLSRRTFMEQAVNAGALSAAAAVTASAAGDRPNVLYVILEDTGPNMACYGEPLVRTPHLDRFAGEAIRFSQAYCTAPVCSASRSALMSGRYQNNIGAHNHRTWEWHKRPLPAPAKHISEWFRDAGYFTCNLQPAKKAAVNGAAGSGKVDLNFHAGGADKTKFFDGTDWTQRKAGQPFFAHLTIIETHKGQGWKIARQRPKSELVDPDKLKLAAYYPDSPIARDEYANYLDAYQLVDKYVGQVLQRLESEGLAKNTVVVISSDHGPLFRGKQFLYDGGVHIPLLVRLPDGKSAGTVDERFVSGIDIAPTLLGFAGIRPAAGAMQGQDIFGPGYQPRDHVFVARDRMDTSIDRMRGVRTRQYKYIRNYFPGTPYMQANRYKETEYPTWNLVKDWARQGKLNREQALFAAVGKPIEELYDVLADPDEVHNLATDIRFKHALNDLRGLVDGFVAENDKAVGYEDPLDIFRGFNGRMPEDPA
ncbi:MAG TPA: sulfatase [Bryobacteraceae bacterium]|nr:sulfatase [Bryobacteraceae bacterium]